MTSSQPQAFAPQLPGFEVKSWYGLIAPANTPPEIMKVLNQQVNFALQEAAVRSSLATLGGGTTEAMRKHVVQEVVKWAAARGSRFRCP